MSEPPCPDAGRIVISGLCKNFGRVRAVRDLSFTVEPGTVTGFLGPNGAGKTSTLRVLVGLAAPSAGSATIGGLPYARITDPGRVVGAVLEASGFHPGRSGLDHLRVYCAAQGLPDRRAPEVLALVGLSNDARRLVGGYSLGMRQRLSLATALLGDPRVLILDEPANGLDPEGIRWLRQLLRHLAGVEGRTVLISSHVLAEVEQTVDRVVLIAGGQLVGEGSLPELRSSRGAPVIVRTPTPDALAAAVAPLGARLRAGAGGSLEVTGAGSDAVGHAAWAASVELHELRPGTSTLEQIFFELTADGGAAYPPPPPPVTP